MYLCRNIEDTNIKMFILFLCIFSFFPDKN